MRAWGPSPAHSEAGPPRCGRCARPADGRRAEDRPEPAPQVSRQGRLQVLERRAAQVLVRAAHAAQRHRQRFPREAEAEQGKEVLQHLVPPLPQHLAEQSPIFFFLGQQLDRPAKDGALEVADGWGARGPESMPEGLHVPRHGRVTVASARAATTSGRASAASAHFSPNFR